MSGLASVFDLVPDWILQALNFGQAYPKGDEDDLFALGDAWKQAAADLRELEPDLRAVTDATAKFYSGEGAVAVKTELGKLFDGPHSVDELAKALEELGNYTRDGGTQLEYTKIMEGCFALITAYTIYALIAAWPWGSAGVPLALAAGRTTIGMAANRGLQQLALEAGRVGLRTLLKPYLKKIAIAGMKAGAMGLGLDGGIQAYQLGAGHRDSFDIGQNLRTGFEWGAGGLVGAPVGMGMHKLLGRTGLNPAMRGLVSGVVGGSAGGLGMYGGGLAWQIGDQLAHGYFDPNKIDTTFDPKLVIVGAALGGAHGVRHGAGMGRAPSMDSPRVSPTGASAAKAPVVTEASVRDGKALYHDLAKQTHPDRFAAGPEQNRARDVFQRVNDVKIDSKGQYSDQHVARLEQLRSEWNNGAATPRDGSAGRPSEAAMRAEATGRTDSGARAEGGSRAPESGARATDSGARVAERPGTTAPESRAGDRAAAKDGAGRTDPAKNHTSRAGVAEKSGTESNLTAAHKDRPAAVASEQGRTESGPVRATAEAPPGTGEHSTPKDAVPERHRAGEPELGRSEPPAAPESTRNEPATVDPVQSITENVRSWIAERPGRFELTYTDAELATIIGEGRRLGLDHRTIEDLVQVGSRTAKPITAPELAQQMHNWVEVVAERGYPYKFADAAEFRQFSSDLVGGLREAGLPVGDIVVQGSSLRTPRANDVDLAVFTDQSTFDRMLVDRFEGKVALKPVGDALRTLVPLRELSHPQLVALADHIMANRPLYNSEAKTFANATLNGIISSKSDISMPLKSVSKSIQEHYPGQNIESISILVRDGLFDTRPALPVTEPGTRAGSMVDPHHGTAASVGEFHADARPPTRPDLTTREVVHMVEDNLAVVTPEDVAWNRDHKRFYLPGRGDIHVQVGPTTGGAVAEFLARPDGTGYDVHVSPRARDQDVVRGIAHELAEIRLAQEPEIVIDPVRERPDRMTDHLGGRFAEVRVLLNKIDAATIDPARAGQLPGLRHDLADLAAHIDLRQGSTTENLLTSHDPLLAHRYALERSGLTEQRPLFGESLTPTEFDRGSATHLATMSELAVGEHVRDLVTNERRGLDARMREELTRRLFDPIFENPSFREARQLVPMKHLMSSLDPLNVAVNDPNPTPAQRVRDLHEAIDRFHTAMPEPFRNALGPDAFQRMYDAADALAATPNRSAGVLEHSTGRFEIDGAPGSMSDLLHSVDRANRTATENGINIEYTVMIHDPVQGVSAVEIIPRPRPLHRLPLEQNVFGDYNTPASLVHRPPTGVPNGHTVDVGVGRSAFGVEMTPPADRTGGGLVVKTELAEFFAIPSQRRRSLGILDPGPLTEAGTVLVFGDMLGGGHILGDGGTGGVGRIFVNNVSAKLPPEAYLAIAANLEHTLAPGGRIELQWDMKSEAADPSKGTPGDRGHIDGDQLWTALLDHYDNRPPFRIEEYTEFPGAGNNDYDYTIDAGASNVLNKDKMEIYSPPRPDHRMVIVYDPTLSGRLAPPRPR
ncbi:WXG100-like domain-containing protein [Nocardia sp. NPDC055029]